MTTPTMPRTSAELAEFLADTKRAAPVLASVETLTQFMTDFAAQQQHEGTELHRTIQVEAERAMLNWIKENGGTIEASALRSGRLNLSPAAADTSREARRRAVGYNPKAPGAVLDGHFTDPIDFLTTTWHLQNNVDVLTRLNGIRNELSSRVGADGGFLVPETFRAQLLSLALESAIVRSRATTVPMATPRVIFPKLDVSSHSSSVFGGMIAYWTEESAALVESQPKFGRVALDAHKLTGLSIIPNELLRDSAISMTAFLEERWPAALAWFEDLAFMRGTGVGEPLGFLGASNPGAIVVSKETGQSAATIVWENIISMYSRMFPASHPRAVWLATPAAFRQLATMALTVGSGGTAVWLTNGNNAPVLSILGRPVIMSEKLSALGTRGDLAYVDLSYYLIGDLQEMRLESSTDYRFGNDQTTYRIIERLDGRPWLDAPVTPYNGGDTMSAFVELEARA